VEPEIEVAQNRKSESRRLAESNVTTMMLVAVVGVFLVVEFPLAFIFIIVIVENTWSLPIIEPERMAIASLFVNLFILLSYRRPADPPLSSLGLLPVLFTLQHRTPRVVAASPVRRFLLPEPSTI